MGIRYDKKLNQEINRTIRNFNQKIARLEKQERELLPTKITKKQLKEEYSTRVDLKRKLRELQRFSTRGSEEVIKTKGGVRLTRYELQNLKKESARIKRNITRELHRLESSKPKIMGKEQTATYKEMGDTQYLNLLARRKALEKDVTKLSDEQLEKYKTLVEKTRKNQNYMNNIFKENYFKMLTDLGYYFNYDSKKLEYLKDKLLTLNANNFYKLFQEDKIIRAILDYYPVMTNTISAIDPDDIREDVTNLYDNLIDNIDEILKDYI